VVGLCYTPYGRVGENERHIEKESAREREGERKGTETEAERVC